LLGTIRCFAAGKRGDLALIPLVVLSQLLLYAALSSLEYRYRYPLQPLITIVTISPLMLLVDRLRGSWPPALSALQRLRYGPTLAGPHGATEAVRD